MQSTFSSNFRGAGYLRGLDSPEWASVDPETDCAIDAQSQQLAEWTSPLSARELEVASLATLRNADIALALGISRSTVKAHFASITRKTFVEGKPAIAVLADRITARRGPGRETGEGRKVRTA